MSDGARPPEHPFLIEPVVAWPRQAETGCDYLVTVDLSGPLPSGPGEPPDGTGWPHPEEEFTFTVTLDGAPFFVCAALGEPSVVLHRFGGTYGAARFRVSAGRETGPASLWLTVSNQWGVPVRKAELVSEIVAEGPDHVVAAVDQRRREHPRGRPEDRPADRAEGTVTLSFAGADGAWAAWIGDRLERRGPRVLLERWDALAEPSPAGLLRGLRSAAGRVLLVVGERYVPSGPGAHEEWEAALREVVAPDPARFAAVSVTTAPLPAVMAPLAPAHLTGVDAEEAERRLLGRLGLPAGPLPEPARRAPRFPATAPGVWGGVPRRNTRFTGRERLLDDVHRLFRGAEPGAGVLTLYGMSGVGKTQLAAEYAYRFGSEYDVVWWVNAEKRVTYRRLLAELAPKLGLVTGPEYGERLRAVRDALRRGEPYGRWLLILDGADEPDQLWDLVPTGPGHVLITSRNPEWGEHNSRLLDVPVYAREESVAFVRRRAPRLTAAEADQLAEALEDLPLLLDQTAGWLNDSDMSVQAYIGLLEGGIDQDVVKVSADFPLTFQTAWWVLLNNLRETVPESVVLLRLCAFFAPGSIPVHLLRDMPHDGLPDTVARLLTDPEVWNRVIDQLRQYSMARPEAREGESPAAPAEYLSMHRMVHKVVRQGMRDAERSTYVEVVRRALAAADPGRPTEPPSWDAYAEIVPHLEHADVLNTTDRSVQRLVLNCLRYMWFTGEYTSGITLGERALPAWRALLGEDHPRVWELTYHYANLLRSGGEYVRTEAIERAAVEYLRRERGEEDLDHLRAASGLAADLWGMARYEEAHELAQRVFTVYRNLLGEQDARTLNALNNLGFILRMLGRYEETLDIDRRTLEARRRLLRDRHPWILFSETSYAIDLRLLGRYTEAESVQALNLSEHRHVVGADNPQTLRAEHNLALCHYRTGARDKAGRLLARVLERYERKLGETHPQTLAAAVSRSCFAREHGDIDRARELGESVIARYESALSESHPFLIGARANHALILRGVGERENALTTAEGARAGMAAAVGADHPWTLGCAINAAAMLNLVGDPESAAALSRATVTGATGSLGRTHPLTLSARISLAADLRALRDHRQAGRIEDEALADLAETLGARHIHTVAARARNRPFWDFEPQAS